MARSCFSSLSTIFMSLCFLGCGKQPDASSTAQSLRVITANSPGLFATNVAIVAKASAESIAKPEFSGEEERAVKQMELDLEGGNEMEAMAKARVLKESANASMRSSALEVFQWIGRKAIRDITTMINDSDPSISSEAITAWEMVFGEINGDRRKGEVICDSVAILTNQDGIAALLLHASEVDEGVMLPLLSNLIDGNAGTIVGECARETYTFLTGGDVYESAQRTKEFLQNRKNLIPNQQKEK